MTVEQFVAHELGYSRGFGPHASLGFRQNGELVAGVIYHNWSPESGAIEISAASSTRRWLTRERLKAIFDYPFRQAGCRIAVARISEHNERTRKIWRSLGATEYVIPELRGPGEAECIAVLTAEAWFNGKFTKEKTHGQAKTTRAA